MPDLSLDASRKFWSDYNDPTIYRVLTFMESVETWTLDGDATLEKNLQQLGDALDNIEKVKIEDLGHEPYFVAIGSCIKFSRVLRLLQAIDSTHPGSASRVLMHAEENNKDSSDAASIFLMRNLAFERLRILSRVFSQQRLKLIIQALEGEDE